MKPAVDRPSIARTISIEAQGLLPAQIGSPGSLGWRTLVSFSKGQDQIMTSPRPASEVVGVDHLALISCDHGPELLGINRVFDETH